MAACMQVHEEDFVTRFSNGTLSEMEMRRIGFGEVTRHPYLIERTKAEVAGAGPSVFPIPKHAAQDSTTLHHQLSGFLCNTAFDSLIGYISPSAVLVLCTQTLAPWLDRWSGQPKPDDCLLMVQMSHVHETLAVNDVL